MKLEHPGKGDGVSRPEIQTLADIVRLHAALDPERAAIVFEGQTLTFGALEQEALRIASALVSEGLQPGDRIAILDRNRDTFFPVLFGAALARVVLVPLNFRLTRQEVSYILEDSGARLVLAAREFAAALPGAFLEEGEGLRTVWIDAPDADPQGLKAWSSSASSVMPSSPSPSDIAIQMYTSGTTGHPKGVELSHGAMICAAQEGLSVWPAMFRAGASVLATMPLFHIAACNLALAGLYVGARAEILRTASAAGIIKLIAEHRITIAPLPAALIHDIVNLPDIESYDLSCLDTLLIAGSGIRVELLRQAQMVLRCGFALSYGMTECCGGLTYLGPDDCRHDAGEKLRSAGKPFGSSVIRIVDPEGAEVSPGVVGEILCRSGRVMAGYWNRPDETRQALRNGWYHSGDAGYLDKDGYLYVVDRIRDMIISGGENIYPAEIENVLGTCQGVADCAVVGVPDEKWGESVVACIICGEGESLDPAQIDGFLRKRLAAFKVPRQYVFLDAFPRNASGKVLKRQLRADLSQKV